VVPKVGARNQPLIRVPPDDAPAVKVSGSACPAVKVEADAGTTTGAEGEGVVCPRAVVLTRRDSTALTVASFMT
jgi:hypothetical protein